MPADPGAEERLRAFATWMPGPVAEDLESVLAQLAASREEVERLKAAIAMGPQAHVVGGDPRCTCAPGGLSAHDLERGIFEHWADCPTRSAP